jgi:hypothetical protein
LFFDEGIFWGGEQIVPSKHFAALAADAGAVA